MIKYKLSQFSIVVAIWIFSLVSWLLFPLISISSGELKARELYVDENALLVNSVKHSYIYNTDNTNEVDATEAESIDFINCIIPYDTVYCNYFSNHMIHYAHIDPLQGKATTGDGIFILIPFLEDMKDIANEIAGLLVHRLYNKSPWLSRRVVIVLLPLSSNQIINFVSERFENWLNQYLSNSLHAKERDSEKGDDSLPDDSTRCYQHSNNHDTYVPYRSMCHITTSSSTSSPTAFSTSKCHIRAVHHRQAYVLNLLRLKYPQYYQ
jgi:hypothetical protein